MKALVSSTKMKEALAKLSPVISKVTVVPVISNVKLSFERDKLYLIGTDLETTLISKIECDCKDGFEVLMDFDDIQNILKNLPEQPITIKQEKKIVVIQSDAGVFKLTQGGDIATFPKIPSEDFLYSTEVDEHFFSALYSADSCKNKDSLMVTTNTACLDFRGDVLTIVGTDTFVMFKKDFKLKSQKMQSLVHDKFVQTVKGFRSGTLSIGEKFVKVEQNGDTSITRVQDNKYCFYESIIPKEINYNIKVDRSDFMHTIKLVLATADRAVKKCVLSYEEGAGKLYTTDLATSKDGYCRFKMILEGDMGPISFNGGQMLHILGMLSSEEVDMSIRGPKASIYIKPSDDDTVFCLLQPIML
jgi:DNA polymerase III subunit beta